MSDLSNQKRAGIEAVAGRLSVSWENGSGPCDAYITVAGKRISVDIRILKQRGTARSTAAKLRLRFDKVATRLIERLKNYLGEAVPEGMTVLLAITAPIRLPSKTAGALEEKIRTLLGRRSPRREEKDTIHGNRVQIRLLRHECERAPKVIAFVHNSDSDPVLLFNMTRELLQLTTGEHDRRGTRLANERWLVLISVGERSFSQAYRYVCSQLRPATAYKKVLMLPEDGQVEVWTG